MKKMLFVLSILLVASKSHAIIPLVEVPSSLDVSSAPVVSGTAATVTLSTPSLQGQGPYSSGYTDYITNIRIEAFYTGGVNGASTPISCTTTNLNGNPSWLIPPAITTGTIYVSDMHYFDPLVTINSSSNTVVNCPATANVKWNVNVNHFVAP